MAQENVYNDKQDVLLYNKSRITITGITGVESFDETQITAITQNGEILTVEGKSIEITDFNVDKQILEAKGNFTSFYYDERHFKNNSSIFRRIFGER